jgi:hypothetical protein
VLDGKKADLVSDVMDLGDGPAVLVGAESVGIASDRSFAGSELALNKRHTDSSQKRGGLAREPPIEVQRRLSYVVA